MRDEREAREHPAQSPTGRAVTEADAADMETTDSHLDPNTSSRSGLIDDAEAEQLRTRWREVQQRFVDDPRGAMDAATDVVAGAAKRIELAITERLDHLRRSWPDTSRWTEAETEQLRSLMQRYRDLLDRLLAA